MPDKRHIDLDLTDYKDKQGDRVPPGRYRVQVDDAEADVSANDNPMVNVWLRIIDGEFAGSVIVDRLTITSKSLWRPVNFMRAIGLPTPKKRFRVDVRSFVNKVLDVDVDDGDPYMGRPPRTEVRGYMRILEAVPEASEKGMEVFASDTDDAGEPRDEPLPADASEVDLDDLELG